MKSSASRHCERSEAIQNIAENQAHNDHWIASGYRPRNDDATHLSHSIAPSKKERDSVGCLDEIKSAKVALEGGCRWIQLRMKDASLEEVEQVALQLKPLCKSYNAVFLLNDHVELCKKIKADGVHLGKTDMNPHKARQLLGSDFIIGSTCNTFEDIENLRDTPIDYIGLGPFRFTETKQNLSPILGLEGYKNIVSQCKKSNINIPIVAVGGITADDVVPILQTGIDGIALSSAILRAEDPVREMDKMIKNSVKL